MHIIVYGKHCISPTNTQHSNTRYGFIISFIVHTIHKMTLLIWILPEAGWIWTMSLSYILCEFILIVSFSIELRAGLQQTVLIIHWNMNAWSMRGWCTWNRYKYLLCLRPFSKCPCHVGYVIFHLSFACYVSFTNAFLHI